MLWDTMCDASNDVRGACARLARHAGTPEESQHWWDEAAAVLHDRRGVHIDDVAAQLAARSRYRARLAELDVLIDDE